MLGAASAAGRLGADVGGVITVGAGIAVDGAVCCPAALSRRAVALAVARARRWRSARSPRSTSPTGGDGHFTRTVLHADDGGALWDIVTRRYKLAFNVLAPRAMPFVTALALLAVAYGVRYRERIYAPLRRRPGLAAPRCAAAWPPRVAARCSTTPGPVLLVFGVFVLAVATAYVRGDPRLAPMRDTPDRPQV